MIEPQQTPLRSKKSKGGEFIDELTVTALFVVSRGIISWLGIRPDINHLYNHWQHLDATLLKGDHFLQSLLLLHSQPPLWNGVLSLILRASGGTESSFLMGYRIFTFTLSLSTAVLILRSLKRLQLPRQLSFAASTLYIAGSSSYFYESYIFYPMLTAFLAVVFFSCIAYGFTATDTLIRWTWTLGGCLSLFLLSLTWTVFHPIFVVTASSAALWKALGNNGQLVSKGRLFRQAALMGSIALLAGLAFAVPIKNHILFGHFGSGSWMGMNLAQVAPKRIERCEFTALEEREIVGTEEQSRFTRSSKEPALKALTKRSGGGTNFNHAGYIARSSACQRKAVEAIASNPLSFTIARVTQFIYSHSLLSDSYFYSPKGLENGSAGRQVADARNNIYIPVHLKPGSRRHLAPFLIPLGIAAGSWILMFSKSFRMATPKGAYEAIWAGFFIMAWIYVTGYLFNGVEQERMRFTIEPLFIAWIAALGYYVVHPFAHRDLGK